MELSLKTIHLYLITIAAFFIAVSFSTEFAGNESLNEWILIKKRTAVSCGIPAGFPVIKSHTNERDDGTGCSHSWRAAGSLCATNDHKRRQIKVIV